MVSSNFLSSLQDHPDRNMTDGNQIDREPMLIQRKWLTFLLIALVFRALFVVWQVHDRKPADSPATWYWEVTDTPGYIEPIESILNGGDYSPDYRMPGVGAPYWIFRQFLSQTASYKALVALQWLLSGLSVLLLALLALRLTGSHRAALATYILFLLSTYTSWYDTALSSDSLSPSVLVIQAYLFQRALDKRDHRLLFLCGAFIAWLIFLRPVSSLLLIPAVVLIYIHWGKTLAVRALLIFLIPFTLVETAWVIRNWRANHEFNPLTNQGMMPDAISKHHLGYMMRFLQGYGGNYIWWDPGADIRWFGRWYCCAEKDNEGRLAGPPPSYAYAPGYDLDSLVMVSELFRAALNGQLSSADSIAAVTKADAALDRYTELHAKGAPFMHHVLSRFLMVPNMVGQKGAETLFETPFNELPLWMKFFKLFQMALYVFAVMIGTIAAFTMLWNWRKARSLLARWIPLVAVYMVLVYPLVLKMAEFRFMVHIFPIILLLAVCFSVVLVEKWLGQNTPSKIT
ncbi:MAG TPA: hypothetical protein PK149_02095 [Flavobacteriales bacterium]|nr:hypothetical protein [Flavobacteriales bacterium]